MKIVTVSPSVLESDHAATLYPGQYLMREANVRDFQESFCSTGLNFFEKIEPFERRNWHWDERAELPKSMLVWNSGALGDQLYMTALIGAIKKRLPQCQIDVVVQGNHGFWNNNLDVRTARYEFVRLDCSCDAKDDVAYKIVPHKHTALDHYDAYFFVDEDIANLTGLDQPNCYEYLFEMAGLPYAGEQPIVYLSAYDEVQALLLSANVSAGRGAQISANYVVLGLHASAHTRDISVEQWVAIARGIADYGKEVEDFTIYSLADNEYGHSIQKALNCIPGHIPLYQTLKPMQIAALLRLAMCVVSVDSMAVHLSAAVKAPCVAIMTTVPPQARVSTYPLCVGLWAEKACAWAGCSWKGGSFTFRAADISVVAPCYIPLKSFCSIGAAIKPGHVLSAVEKAMEAKFEFDGYQVHSLPIFK